MVTKGIITSIDFNGNTCQVRIPLFETAGNDPIISTAVVSNTPGSYNGYKVDDVVLVAFEDGKMETPVVIGKLYLGAEKEKADPRGSLNTESLVAAKTAAVPADTKLTTNTDKNLPNTMNPYANLSSVANNLNKLNTDVNYLDVFTNNQFKSVITDVNKQGEQLRSEIKQTSSNIEAKVDKEHDSTTTGLGWNLTTDSWKINAQDTVNGVVKDINIVTIDRNGMSIAGDLKLSGYPRNITVLYAQTGSNKDYPELYKFTETKFPTPFPSGDEDKDKTWYYGKYIKITEADKEKYVLIFKENFEHYEELIDIGTTKTYNREINSEWKTETPARVDGQYIWQWTHTESFLFDKNTNSWNEQDDDKIVCITGADGKDGTAGEPATTYWAKLSTAVHTGKNQKSNIEITPYAKTGSSQEVIDITAYFKYSLNNGTTWNSDNWTLLQDNKIIILAKDIKADNIIVKLAHAYTDPNDSTKLIYNEYETETITYSPLNTPIIDLTNDTDVIKYKPDGHKITADVSSTAQVYLGGSQEAASYDWTVTSGAAKISTSNSNQTVTVTSITGDGDKAIITCTATTTNFKNEKGDSVTITKDFVVSREVVVASYWLSFSPVHTGNLQQTDIEVKALAKIGNDSESKDTNAYFRYSWDNGSNWSNNGEWKQYENATLIIKKADIKDRNLRIQATHDSKGDNRQVYEDETITYSPLNTPVLDLTNDSGAIAYDGNTMLGNSVSSTAAVYLNGATVSGCTFAWTAANCTISGANTATVTVSAIDDGESEGTATCRVTGIPNYRDTELVKVFTVAKQYKGNKGTDGPAPTSSTTYYIYSADTPSLDDPKWETDPDNLDKPNGGYFCWTKTVTTYSDDKTVTDGPNKDAAFALAQGKTTNYYSDTDPTGAYSVKKGDCWFKTISSTNSEYNGDAAGQKQGKLYQCSGFNADGKAIWEDVGGELVANKLTANYINALDITAKKIIVLNNNNAGQSELNPILFEADGLSGAGSVKIANFTVNQTGLYSGNHNRLESEEDGVYLGADGISIGSNFKVTAGNVIISDYTKSTIKKYRKIEYDNEREAAAKYTDWDNWDSSNWLSKIPNREEGKYIWEWTKEVKGNSTDDISTWEDKGKICITGAKGDPGEQGYSIVASISRPSFTEANWNTYGSIGHSETWSDTSAIRNGCRVGDIFTVVGTATDTKNAHVLYYKSTTASGNLVGTCFSHSVAERGNRGEAGNGISSITNYYLVSNNNSGIVNTSGDWKTVPPTTDSANKYLWNYVLITYTNSDPTKTIPCIIGVHGEKGDPGVTGRSVSSVTKYYKLATSKPNPPNMKEPTDWYTSPPSFVKGNNYYESDRTIYDDDTFSWSEVIENSMMTVDFINSLGITAKKITVLQDNSKESNDSNPILFQADGTSNNSGVKIGGFTVDSNRLYAGTPGTSNSIELASFYNLIAYTSNNQGVASSYAVSKITVNKDITNLTVYIRSYAESSFDYTMISKPNVSSYPTSSSSSNVKAHTSLKQNSSSALAGYTEVNYYNLKQNDYIYIVYKKDVSTNSGTDTGYLLIPETTDISITAVGDTYYFVRDASLDIDRISIKVGSNFSVDTEGKICTKAGKIGALELTPTTLSVGKRFSGDNSFLYLNTENNYTPTGWNDRAYNAISTLEASSARFNVQILGMDSDSYGGDTVIYMDGRHYADNGLVSVYQTQSGDQDNYQVCSRIPITKFDRLPISIGGDGSPYIIPGPKNWDNKRYAPVRIILSGERLNPATDTWYDMSGLCELYGIIIIDGVATSAIAKASNTSLSGYSQIATAYYENHDLRAFQRGTLDSTSQIPYSSLWVGNDGDGGSVSKISFIITGWAVSELV